MKKCHMPRDAKLYVVCECFGKMRENMVGIYPIGSIQFLQIAMLNNLITLTFVKLIFSQDNTIALSPN